MFKEAVYPDGRSVLVTYDALDHLSRVKDWLGEIVFVNDNAGRITQVTDHRGQVLRYEWNPDGSKKWMQYPDGSEVSYEYDNALRLSEVESGEFRLSYRYDDHNRIMECARGNGVKSLYHYNEAGNISELIHLCHGREIEHLSYRYDRLGNPIRIRRQSGEQGYSYLREFTYDRNSRLTEVKEDDRIIRQYRYDGYGNRIGMLRFNKGSIEDIEKIEYSYNPLNQLIQMGERNYGYTLNGELGSSEGQSAPYSYEYDAVGRLNSISCAGRILQRNEYNGLGYRIRTEIQPGGMPWMAPETDYTVDHTDEYARILMEQGDGARIYFWLNNELHGMPKEEHYVLTDMQHTPLRVMDREGDTRNIYRYSEFGTLEDAVEEIPLPFGFTGYYRENGQDLYFANAREYDSEKGSFLSKDAYRYIEYTNPNTMNLYQYVQGNPLRYVDYSGHECIEENNYFVNLNKMMNVNMPGSLSAEDVRLNRIIGNIMQIDHPTGEKGGLKNLLSGTGQSRLLSYNLNGLNQGVVSPLARLSNMGIMNLTLLSVIEWVPVDGAGSESDKNNRTVLDAKLGENVEKIIKTGMQIMENAIEAVKNTSLDKYQFEDEEFAYELLKQGFPEGYIVHLMKIHEEYPEWTFKAVKTQMDYNEFVELECQEGKKCAQREAYCDTNKYKHEDSDKYFEANRESIEYFTHPYSMLQIDNGQNNCKNIMQFLDVKQDNLPDEYVREMVEKIIVNNSVKSKGADAIAEAEEIVDAIINDSDGTVCPIILAAICAGEGGIEKIKKENTGDAHYNLFNMKAYNGADDAAQAASEGGWTTPSSCVQGSMAYFKEFIDNGQTTLFAFDWNWNKNKNENEEKGMHQYATLVNDAEEKALMMTIRDWVELDLHQPFTFTIPVFENVPSYSEDEEFVPYPDPAWE